MNVLNLHSYAYFGSKQFPVNIPIICSSAFINQVIQSPSDYLRRYLNLNETEPDNIINSNFGFDIWGAYRKATQYVGLLNTDPVSIELNDIIKVSSLLGINASILRLDNTYTGSGDYYKATRLTPTRGVEDYAIPSGGAGEGAIGGITFSATSVSNFHTSAFGENHANISLISNTANVYFKVMPDDYIVNGYVNPIYLTTTKNFSIDVNVRIIFNNAFDTITTIQIMSCLPSKNGMYGGLFNNVQIPFEDIQNDDIENPYGADGTSTTGGGDGTLGGEGLDSIDATDIPDLPSLSGAATGFVTMYAPTSSQISSLGNFLWSNQWSLDTYKKLFADPMQGIIGLGIVPILPTSGGSRNIMFGNVDTGVNCSFLASQYVKKDCGSVSIEKYVGSFMDYSPYVKISLFLPYIGFVNLGTDDIMGGSINVQYNIDVLSGDCVAFVKHNTKGVLYSYNGNCLTNVPVSGQNYSNALKNYYESIAGIIPSTTNGAAGGGVAGAVGGAAAGTINAASNVILNSKPTFQRSGNIGGSAGIMGVQKPFLIIERPNISVPNNVQNYLGQTSNITANLGTCKGMTICEYAHLNNISATAEELAEIESLLKAGVIL